jgi:hypothetical protein
MPPGRAWPHKPDQQNKQALKDKQAIRDAFFPLKSTTYATKGEVLWDQGEGFCVQGGVFCEAKVRIFVSQSGVPCDAR